MAAIRAISRSLEQYLPVYLNLLSLPAGAYPLSPGLHDEELRRTTQLALSALITLSAERKPVVVLLEDWQWADEASDAALKYLAGVMTHTPLLVAVNYRPDHKPEWGDPSHLTGIGLRPMEPDLSEKVVRAVLRVELLPEGLAGLIHERTAGNPYFIEEICRSLLERGMLQVREARQAVLTESLEKLALPDTVHAVVRSRLDRLDPQTREVLALAAVIGRSFGEPVLARLCSTSVELAAVLEQLKALELVQQVRVLPEAEFVFRQAVTQEVAYEGQLLKRRKETHLLIAEAIAGLYAGRLTDHHETLARHYQQAEEWNRAVPHLLSAAETAKAHYAYRAALELCTQALAAATLGGAPGEERVRGLVLLGDLRSLLGEMEPANQRYRQALAFTRDPPKRQMIENKIHRPHSVVRDEGKIV